VVFRGGEGALQVLPPLVDVIPEARLNLVIYYLRQVIIIFWLYYGFKNKSTKKCRMRFRKHTH
jgi:hypothetical protein